jgi:hypothetical protein
MPCRGDSRNRWRRRAGQIAFKVSFASSTPLEMRVRRDMKSKSTMNEECVVGVYNSLQQAEQAVRILRRADFRTEQISVVASNLPANPALVKELRLGDDSVRDAAIGAGLGGILGLLAGIGLAAIPVAGLIVFLVGPIGGAATGTIVGGLIGSMVGWGVHKDHIEHYEQLVRDGKALVTLNGTPLELVHGERILRETDVIEVNLHAKTGSDAPGVYPG